jgi:ABC-type transport system substrate-binding protein
VVGVGEPYSRRRFLRDVGRLGGAAVVLVACTPAAEPPSSGPTGPGAGASAQLAGLPALEGGQVVTDRALFPTVFHESPEFTALTAAGQLPPVAARVGRDPLVVRPVHEVGRYGGRLRRGLIGTSDRQNGARFCAGPDSLLYWDYQWQHVVPNIAADYELSDGARVLTLHLRRGLRWSDGVPFTADDIIFWREDVSLDAELGGGATSLLAGGRQVRVIGIPYAKWFASGGRDGTEPPAVALLKDAMRLYQRGRQAATDADRAALGQQLYRLHADQVWTIGVVGRGLSIYGVYTARNTLRNIPGRMLNTNHQKTPSNALPMTFYYR